MAPVTRRRLLLWGGAPLLAIGAAFCRRDDTSAPPGGKTTLHYPPQESAGGAPADTGLAQSADAALARPAEAALARPVEAALALPAYLRPVVDPGTGCRLTRVTDRAAFGTEERVLKHDYARRSAWNADGTRLLLIRPYPARLLDGRDYRLLGLHRTPSDPLWSHRDPDRVFGLQDETRLVAYSIATRRTEVLHEFPAGRNLGIGGGEGVQSLDDRHVALLATDAHGVDLLVHDLEAGRPDRLRFDGYTGPNGDIDWAGVSPSGRFVVVKIDRGPADRGFDVFERRTLAFQRRLLAGSQSHADMGFDRAGNEVLVSAGDGSSAIVSAGLADGRVRIELPAAAVSYNVHVSCRNFRRPGWCYVSTYREATGLEAPLYRSVFALKLDGSGTIERFAGARFAQDPVDLPYERQAWAVPNPTGDKVLFASDWGDASARAQVHAFVAGASG